MPYFWCNSVDGVGEGEQGVLRGVREGEGGARIGDGGNAADPERTLRGCLERSRRAPLDRSDRSPSPTPPFAIHNSSSLYI